LIDPATSNIDGYVQYPAGFLLSVPQMSIR